MLKETTPSNYWHVHLWVYVFVCNYIRSCVLNSRGDIQSNYFCLHAYCRNFLDKINQDKNLNDIECDQNSTDFKRIISVNKGVSRENKKNCRIIVTV